MNDLLQLLSVEKTFFTVFSYQMSYIEFFGTLFNLWCVWLVARKNIWTRPVGIVGVLLFGVLFYQLHLYADLFEQWYYLITGVFGWYAWAKHRQPKDAPDDIVVKRNSLQTNLVWLAVIAGFTGLGTWVMTNIHVWLPKLFPEPASLPLLDVFTTVMSFAAQFMLIQKRLENWLLWILVDIIGIGLYWYKEVPFVALLYAVFLVLATQGFFTWRRALKQQEKGHEKRIGDRQVLPVA